MRKRASGKCQRGTPREATVEVFIPQSPEELQGRVVAFGFTVTGNRGKSSAPATIYNKDHKKEIAAHKQFLKRVEEAKRQKKKVTFRQVLAVPLFGALKKKDRDYYKERADQESRYPFTKYTMSPEFCRTRMLLHLRLLVLTL